MSTDMPPATASREIVVPINVDEVKRWSEDFVAVVESVRFDVFRAGVVLVLLTTAVSALLLPTRQSVEGTPLTVALLVAGATIAAAGHVLVRPRPYYRILSNDSKAQWIIVLVAAAQISVVLPLHSQLWVPACALISLLGTLLPLRRTLLFCAVVLGANLSAHIVVGDLATGPPEAVLGLWEGFPFWTVLIATVMARIVRRVTDLYIERADPPTQETLGVPAWLWQEPLQLPDGVTSAARISRKLTDRQQQVFALLMAGYRTSEIATELGIKDARVSRLIADALKRTNTPNKYALIKMLAVEWWGTGPATRLRAYQPELTPNARDISPNNAIPAT